MIRIDLTYQDAKRLRALLADLVYPSFPDVVEALRDELATADEDERLTRKNEEERQEGRR